MTQQGNDEAHGRQDRAEDARDAEIARERLAEIARAPESVVSGGALRARLAAWEAEPESEGYPRDCTSPTGHEWNSPEENERCYCLNCGADGDA